MAVDHWDGCFALHDINGLRVCPEHPVRSPNGSWSLASEHAPESVSYVECMYDFELSCGHTAEINGIELCTLGHGFTINDSDSLFGYGWKNNPRRALFEQAQARRLTAGAPPSDVAYALQKEDWHEQLEGTREGAGQLE